MTINKSDERSKKYERTRKNRKFKAEEFQSGRSTVLNAVEK